MIRANVSLIYLTEYQSGLMEDSDPVEVQERERKRYKRREEENPVNT